MAEKTGCNPFRWLFGLPFTAAGIFIIGQSVTGKMNSSSDAINNSLPMGIFVGLLFLIPGSFVLFPSLWQRIAGSQSLSETLFAGTIALFMGVFIFVMSFIDSDDAFNAPRWVAAAAGAAFALVGALLIKTAIFDKGQQNEKSLFNLVIAAALFTAFGSIVTWVSLGAGEREFGSTISIPFLSISGSGNELLRRLCFLPGVIILDVGAFVLWYHIAVRLMQNIKGRVSNSKEKQRSSP